MPLLQPDTEGQSEPYPITLTSNGIFAFIGSDPDLIHLEEALSQPEREEFIKSMKKDFQDNINQGQ